MPRDLSDRLFWIAKEEEIKRAEDTDIYFLNTVEVLKRKGYEPEVVMEVYARTLPYTENWGIVAGIYEVAKLLEGLPVDVNAMEEGEVFLVSHNSIAYEPVLQIEGRYTDFANYENPMLGFICSSSSISTKAARTKMAAGDKIVFSFGTRRVHPFIAPTVERAVYLGGFDGLSNMLGSRLLNKKPFGTMPHSLILCIGDQRKAWKAFDETLPEEVPRIALVDTLYDEKTESIMALETLGKRLFGVRLDTPSSRKGNWREIIEEVRWELGIRGGKSVKIFISGGIDEKEVTELSDMVDGFGIGTSVSASPIIDFSAKIVEVKLEGESILRAKRGDISGKKQVFRKLERFEDTVAPWDSHPPDGSQPLLHRLVEKGEIVREFKEIDDLRENVLSSTKRLRVIRPILRSILF